MSKTRSAFEAYNEAILKTFDEIVAESQAFCPGCNTTIGPFDTLCPDCKADDDSDARGDQEAREGRDV